MVVEDQHALVGQRLVPEVGGRQARQPAADDDQVVGLAGVGVDRRVGGCEVAAAGWRRSSRSPRRAARAAPAASADSAGSPAGAWPARAPSGAVRPPATAAPATPSAIPLRKSRRGMRRSMPSWRNSVTPHHLAAGVAGVRHDPPPFLGLPEQVRHAAHRHHACRRSCSGCCSRWRSPRWRSARRRSRW